ncbi:Ras GTPase [Cavenderia fasciculata]|uniref:Peptide-methionine (S)-S-oxide reductase n=1 Tax=Cavenderia fasciculata TaxID=261658 RepID=F4PRP2_CACFS|nr:Ras GTPase [Cavenderia fasciculata]EGG20541.1 Ras GTPase [Cavenderia fasciculata]|eukprot:XP_004358391.1 Ras GTPase [Cavenderia fasciculata]
MGKKDKGKSQTPQKSKYFVAVMGSGSVGKSALTVQFTQGIFVDKYDPTVEDTYTKSFELDGESVCIEVLDTAGSEVLVAMRELYMKSAEGFVLVYSILVKSTFIELKDIIEQLFRVKEEEEVPIVLVGNKIDLDSHREVSNNDGKTLANSYPNCEFWETSCKDRINVDNVFHSIVRKIRDKYKKEGVPTKEKKDKYMTIQKATLAGGCFWSVELVFQRVMGVVSTKVGYTQGHKVNPTYKEVCTGTTGHTEAVELEYDDTVVSYPALLDVFWKKIDPTTLNRQGGDSGTQYRSGIYYHNDQQRVEAEKSRDEEQKKHREKIVVEVLPSSHFYFAEDYHQQYLAKGGQCSKKGSTDKIRCYVVHHDLQLQVSASSFDTLYLCDLGQEFHNRTVIHVAYKLGNGGSKTCLVSEEEPTIYRIRLSLFGQEQQSPPSYDLTGTCVALDSTSPCYSYLTYTNVYMTNGSASQKELVAYDLMFRSEALLGTCGTYFESMACSIIYPPCTFVTINSTNTTIVIPSDICYPFCMNTIERCHDIIGSIEDLTTPQLKAYTNCTSLNPLGQPLYPNISTVYDFSSVGGSSQQEVQCFIPTVRSDIIENCPEPFVIVPKEKRAKYSGGYYVLGDGNCTVPCPFEIFTSEQTASLALSDAILYPSSMVSAVIIIIIFGVFPNKISPRMECLIALGVSTIILGVAYYIQGVKDHFVCGDDTRYSTQQDHICWLQGLLFQFGGLSFVFWLCFLCYDFVLTLLMSIYVRIGIWALSGLLSVIPLIGNKYGASIGSQGGCWILSDDKKAWQYAAYFVPSWIALFFTLASCCFSTYKTLSMYKYSQNTKVLIFNIISKLTGIEFKEPPPKLPIHPSTSSLSGANRRSGSVRYSKQYLSKSFLNLSSSSGGVDQTNPPSQDPTKKDDESINNNNNNNNVDNDFNYADKSPPPPNNNNEPKDSNI